MTSLSHSPPLHASHEVVTNREVSSPTFFIDVPEKGLKADEDHFLSDS